MKKLKLLFLFLLFTISVMAQLQLSELQKGLIFHWQGSEWNPVRDMVSGTLGTATATYNVLGRGGEGRRYLQNTSTTYASIADDPRYDFGTGDFTLIFSITPDNITDNGNYIIVKYDGVGYAVDQQDAGIRILFRDATHIVNAVIANDILQVGIKTTCAIVFNRANNAVLYINGSTTPYATLDISTIEGTVSNSSDFIVGNSGTYNVGFNGQVHFVRAFNYASTTAQVANYSKTEYPIEWVDRGAGTELITNAADREFSSNTGYWSDLGTGVSITGGVLRFTDAPSQNTALHTPLGTVGKAYMTTSIISGYEHGGVTPYVSGVINPSRTGNGTWVNYTSPLAASSYVFQKVDGSTTLDIEYFSVTQLGCVLDLNAEGLARASDNTYNVGYWKDYTNTVVATVSGAVPVIPPASNLKGTMFPLYTSKMVFSQVPVVTGDITISFSFRLINCTNLPDIISSSALIIFVHSSNHLYVTRNGSTYMASNEHIDINKDYKIVITSSAAGLTTTYFNNVKGVSIASAGAPSAITTMTLGGTTHGGNNPQIYIMSGIDFYNYILSTEEIKFLYETNQ